MKTNIEIYDAIETDYDGYDFALCEAFLAAWLAEHSDEAVAYFEVITRRVALPEDWHRERFPNGYKPLFLAPQAEWQPIETAPKDNKRQLYLASFNSDGEMIHLDFGGIWQAESESWEMPQVYYYWASINGIEEPTHWAYQDEPLPTTAPQAEGKVLVPEETAP